MRNPTRALLVAIACCLGLFSAPVAGDTLVEGIQPYQVFPFEGYKAAIPFTTTIDEGELLAEVITAEDGNIVLYQTWEIAHDAPRIETIQTDGVTGTVRTCSKDLTIDGVPIGGQYVLRFEHKGRSQRFDHIQVGEVWVVGGGTNAMGAAVRYPPDPVSGVRFFKDGAWGPGTAPLFTPETPLPDGLVPSSPWLRAAQVYHTATGIPVGILGMAWNDLTLRDLVSEEFEGSEEYVDLIQGRAAGAARFCWYQGEADADQEGWPTYGLLLAAVARAARESARNPDMTVLIVQIGSEEIAESAATPYFGRIREAQRSFCAEDERSILVPALPCARSDGWHLSEEGTRDLGPRIGEAFAVLHKRKGKPRLWEGPRAARIAFSDHTRRRVLIEFDSTDGIVVAENAAQYFLVTDDRHLGYGEVLKVGILDGVLAVEVAGARIGSATPSAIEGKMDLPLADTGFIRVTRAAKFGNYAVQLDLDQPAGPGAKVSYALMNNAKAVLRGEDGRFACTFAYLPIAEAEE